MKLFKATLLVLILFVLSSWNKPGHQVTGSIAFQYLNENSPATVTKVVNLMKKHPEFNTRWKSTYDGLTGNDKNMYLFMVAAEWPDIIKDDNPNGYPLDKNCHYINWPVTFAAGTHVDQPDPVNSLSQLKKKLDVLKSTKPAADKAMALCWVFHLLGDLHQPLHNVALFGTGFPTDGDHGGNYFFVKKSQSSSTIKLHAFWDDVITNSTVFNSLKTTATDIKTSQQVQYNKTIPLDYEKWSKDFVTIAEKHVYKFNGTIVKSGTSTNGKVVPAGYEANAKTVSKKQMAEAGMRLAVILEKTL